MGRPKRTAVPAAFTVTAAPPDGSAATAPDAPTAQTTDVLERTAGEGQRGPQARVMRWNENMRAYATLDTVTAEVVDEAWIQQEYGGGKYRVYYWGAMADGTYGYLAKQGKEFIIDDSIPFKGAARNRPASGTVHNPDGSVAGGPAGSSLLDMGMLQLFTTMQDNSKAMMTMMRDNSVAQAAMLERIVAPRDNGMVPLLAALTPLLAPLITGMVQRKDPMELTREMMALMKPAPGEHSSMKDTLGAVREMIEVRDLLSPGGLGEESEGGRWIGLLEKVIPGALDVLKQEAAKQGVPLARVTARPIPAPMSAPPLGPMPGSIAPPAAVPRSTETPPMPDEWTALEPYVARLANMAANNKAPFGVMQTIVTMAPAPMVAAIRELVAKEDATQILVTRFQALMPYAAWTAQLVDEFRNEFFGSDEDDEPAAAGEPAPGDTHVEDAP